MESIDNFYKSKKWQSVRKSALIRDRYMCQCCKAYNKNVQADHVHHIFPRDKYSEYQYELWNLMSLCKKCHDEMHNHYTGELSNKGVLFMRSIAAVKGINLNMKEQTILVTGLRGSGKSTYCKKEMDSETLVYDMDAIASAFRLKMPHEEYFKPARRMANDFLKGFLIKAHDYAKKVYIIRTAPPIKEVEDIAPSKVVICKRHYVNREMDDIKSAQQRLDDLENYCKHNKSIELVVIE